MNPCRLFVLFAIALLISTGCGKHVVDAVVEDDGGSDGDTDTDTDTDADTDTDTDTDSETGGPDQIRVGVLVPDYFDATPVKIRAEYRQQMPPVGEPNGEGETIDDPPIEAVPAPPWSYVSHQDALEGFYYVHIVLFVEGGGAERPMDGIDWVGATLFPVELGEGTGMVDVGEIQLHQAGGI